MNRPAKDCRDALTQSSARSSTQLLVVLDTNCLIYAVTPSSEAFPAMQEILAAAAKGRIAIRVSLHSIHELEESIEAHPDEALSLARSLPQLPYFPIGTIEELLGTIEGLAGTFDDMEANELLQQQLERLAKAGTDLRDRGAVVDAIRAGADAFVTSDGQLCKSGPASRIRAAVGLMVVRPQALAQKLRA